MARRFISVVLIGLVVALVPTVSVFASASTTTTITRMPFGFTALVNPCTGEILDMTGTVQIVTHTTIDSTGAAHTKFHFNSQGVSGVSRTTGMTYRLVDTVNNTTYQGPLPAVVTSVSTIKLIGPGPGNNQVLRFQVHSTINANGELTSSVFNQENECR
jgi:hypothetical protein